MPACPVCETEAREGGECAVCGHRLEGGAGTRVEVEPLPGLEPTLFAGAAAEGERLPEVEPTRYVQAGDLPPDPVAVEPTLAARVNPAVEPLAGLEPTLAEPVPDDGREPAAAFACRYCRTPAPPTEIFCFRCGMRLPREAATAAEAARVPVPCRSCGTPTLGTVCIACGVRTAR
ncbi:MAG TPA: hypothetical protein VMK42_15245 [Anaeromyxobacteraceae bacterium]|nr:hypothetical protein [Anaeromyxobacteraceae bacterium]